MKCIFCGQEHSDVEDPEDEKIPNCPVCARKMSYKNRIWELLDQVQDLVEKLKSG